MELILDNTQISAFDTCPTKYYWRHIRNLVQIEGKSAPLEFGTAIHTALETLYKGGSQKEVLDAFAKAMENAATDDKRNLANGINILLGYFTKWLPDPFKVIEVEVPIQWELASDLVFCGKVDLIVEWAGQIYVLDHKTSASISQFCAQPNHQFTGYVYGTKVLGHKTIGAIINLIAVLKTKTDYHRAITTRSDFELEDWRRHVLSVHHRILQALEIGYFEKVTTNCNWCPYKHLCNSQPEIVEQVIPQYYREEKWEPWKAEVAME